MKNILLLLSIISYTVTVAKSNQSSSDVIKYYDKLSTIKSTNYYSIAINYYYSSSTSYESEDDNGLSGYNFIIKISSGFSSKKFYI